MSRSDSGPPVYYYYNIMHASVQESVQILQDDKLLSKVRTIILSISELILPWISNMIEALLVSLWQVYSPRSASSKELNVSVRLVTPCSLIISPTVTRLSVLSSSPLGESHIRVDTLSFVRHVRLYGSPNTGSDPLSLRMETPDKAGGGAVTGKGWKSRNKKKKVDSV